MKCSVSLEREAQIGAISSWCPNLGPCWTVGYGNAKADTWIGVGEGAQRTEEKGAVYSGSAGEEI